MTMPDRFTFYFDPSCPWTWITARWLVDAAEQVGADIEWRNLSLAVVNADREIPEQYRSAREAGTRAHRVIAALRADGRNDLVSAFYTEWGRRVHHDGHEPSSALAGEVAEAVGAGTWTGAADDESWDAEVERSTKEGQELAGGDVGSPVLAFGAPAVGAFGPIVSPPPQGDDAVALLQQVTAAIASPAFYELKRNRNDAPQFGPRP
jgi:hypothetical protein